MTTRRTKLEKGLSLKTEPSNEAVAEALGWEYDDIYGWVEPSKESGHIHHDIDGLPDFTHDLNASWKYVWPVLSGLLLKTPGSGYISRYERVIISAIESPNPAMYFATKLIELKK